MEVRAFICDAATVREGLLHILGAGITRINRQAFPAPFGAAVAMMLILHPTEADRDHALDVRLQGSDGAELAKIDGGFRSEKGPDLQPGEMIASPIVLSLHNAVLPGAGSYSVEIL